MKPNKKIEAINKIRQWRKKAHKEIDDCLFIKHKLSWLDKLFGARLSNADIYKAKIDLTALEMMNKVTEYQRVINSR